MCAVRFRPDTKSEALQARYEVGGGGCLAEEGEVPYMTPPPPRPPGSASVCRYAADIVPL